MTKRCFLLVSLLALSAGAALSALESLDARLPGTFARAMPAAINPLNVDCTYAVLNATVLVDGRITMIPQPEGGWSIRMKAGDMEIAGTTANGLLYGESRYSMSQPEMVKKWKYDSRSSRTTKNGPDFVTEGNLSLQGKVGSKFSINMGGAPLDSDFLGFQLAGLAARKAGSFNADFLIKNQGMKVNADFVFARADAAKIEAMLSESGNFRAGLSKILKPGCLVYTINLTGIVGAFYKASVYAAFTDEPVPAFLAYWNTNPKDREGLWVKPSAETASN